MQRLRKGDDVVVIAGRDKGKRGNVLRVMPDGRIVVADVNMVKRHQRPTKQYQHGGIIEKEGAISINKAMLVCPKCNLPTRTGIKMINQVKARICRKCEEIVDNI